MNKWLIYIIDDEKTDRILTTYDIEQIIEGSICKNFETVNAAFADLEHKILHSPLELPNLIFLDINMPVKNGWNFISLYEPLAKKFQGKLPHIYLLSSTFLPADATRANDNPLIEGLIVKPLTKSIIEDLKAKHFFNE